MLLWGICTVRGELNKSFDSVIRYLEMVMSETKDGYEPTLMCDDCGLWVKYKDHQDRIFIEKVAACKNNS